MSISTSAKKPTANSQPPTAKNKAVFLDRDGVLNEEMGDYVWTPDHFRVLPGVPASLARLKAAGYYLIVVTNQAGIAKGLYTRAHVRALHELLQQAAGYQLDALYMSESHPSVSESILRKPDSGMLEKASARFHLDPAQCWLVGDRARDLKAAARVGVQGILVGHAEPVGGELPRAADLAGATDLILSAPGV
ncbi:MAG: D-glycero-alpha-D-manno-heptose-1,7-bisphosphate 7-phosphatase [Janthinobacterium lividum]